MRILTTLITALLLMQSTVRAEEPWRFIALADWHGAELYVQLNRYPGGEEQNAASLKMLKENKNVLFVTVDVFHQEDPDKQIGMQGSVTGAVVGEHLVWLDHVLSEARKDASIKHIFVQSHLPVLQPVRRVNSSGMLMDDEMESDFWKTLRKHSVDIYFAGEVHSNTLNTSEEDMVLINTGRAWLKKLNGVMNLNLNDGERGLLMSENQRLIVTGQKLNEPQDYCICK